ncbi:MAG: SPFH domain-containing protein [Candidatus Gracilibacteria bacterium]|nr:SPFH domain-containing protein [Candidatus Gracilibacteria bacterium]MDD4530469.1 SPFH domain-containing protein [Candidatus Gracilibacteria bacterium]
MTEFIIILAIIIVIANIKIVEQNNVFVIEFLGKFSRVMNAGFNVKIPLLERVAEKVSLRSQNFAIDGKYPSKDKVMVDVATNLIYEVVNTLEGIKKFSYVLQNRSQSIAAIVENSLRTYIAKETHEGILEKKDELALHIRTDLEIQFDEWGMVIKSFQITNVNFPVTITDAMSEVVASQQLKNAAENKGEATKIQAIKEAEAEKERKRLQGEGIALERAAIAKGLEENVKIMQAATGQDARQVINILTMTQYLDTMKTIGMTENTKVIFMDSNINRTVDLMQQLMATGETR